MVFDTIRGQPITDGALYCNNELVPAAEASLFNLASPPFFDPVPVLYGEAVFAIVELSANGAITSETTYVVMQTALSDETWIDMAWCTWSGTTGAANFVLTGGVAGANAFQQTRATGTAPTPLLGSNQAPLGGRLRFVGKSTVNASSSSSSSSSSRGKATGIYAKILYKILGLR